MKLSEQQIEYINRYLKQSGLKYWDVRMEILDHIVLAIEEKTENNTLEFKEALVEVVNNFGNKTRKQYLSNKENTKLVLTGMFSDGVGFQKLQNEKQKQIGVKYTKAYWSVFLNQFKSGIFHLQYLIFVLLSFVLYQYSSKMATLIVGLLLYIPMVVLIFGSITQEFTRNSLHIKKALLSFLFYTAILSLIINGYKMVLAENLKFLWMITLFVLLFPFVRVSILRYISIHKTMKKYYLITLKS